MFGSNTFFHNKKGRKNENAVSNLHIEEIIKKLAQYNIIDTFLSKEEIQQWIAELNALEIKNILGLNIDPANIKFDAALLINRDLLNTTDYNQRIEALVSIENADGWYHLFENLLAPEFLHSDKFYPDIETMKRAESAQMPLWIIGDPNFINSPYHDEDFQLLVTSKDTSGKDCDFLVWDAIATVARNPDSIRSPYHKQDLQTIIKYSAPSLQGSHSYPKSRINNLAIHPISLKDKYHLENMEILANHIEIGNFLFAVMTNAEVIERKDYRNIIREMMENKNNISYVFLVCYYAVGEKNAVDAQNMCLHNYFYEITNHYNIDELIQKVDEKMNVVEGECKEIVSNTLEDNNSIKQKKMFLKKQKKKHIN
ncbi:MAG: hypothetical protein PHN72_05095 [Bacilli bacterium]|nr:hypothetical protein [Bacilli bacterium]